MTVDLAAEGLKMWNSRPGADKNEPFRSRGRNLAEPQWNLSSGGAQAPARRRRTQALPARSHWKDLVLFHVHGDTGAELVSITKPDGRGLSPGY